jgi:hypothetical protein
MILMAFPEAVATPPGRNSSPLRRGKFDLVVVARTRCGELAEFQKGRLT